LGGPRPGARDRGTVLRGRSGPVGAVGPTRGRAAHARRLDDRRPVGRGARGGAGRGRRRLDHRAGHGPAPRGARRAPAAPAPAPGTGVLMRRELPDGYELDDDRDRVDVDAVFRFLSEEAYWVPGRSRQTIERLVRESTRVIGAYAPDGELAGF